AAHPDDDMIFMQPELVDALHAPGSVATIYVTTGDPVKGLWHARDLQAAARVAYGKAAGITEWDCGYVELTVATVYHCRALERPVSLISLDVVDGGIPGERRDSLLHLVDGTVASLPVLGAVGGDVTRDSLIEHITEVLETLAPTEVHALELAGTHGRDHSSHMLSSAFVLWAAARIGFDGPMTWHRGYNVDVEPITLDGAPHDAAKTMLGYYEACSSDCGPCGTSCDSFSPPHQVWLQRQYASSRVIEPRGRLAHDAGCLSADLAVADCALGADVQLSADGALTIGDACIASTPEGGVTLAPCARTAEQYWVLDDEGFLWNGAPPGPAGDMSYTHVRCLATADARASTPVCGDQLRSTWQLISAAPRTP
ncbi:MAG TPA: hypothetical protein VIV40_08865, partial [Kofleriaceae bacterium]